MLTFPSDCDTPAKRTEYCYRAQELLRILHNVMGEWYKQGISVTKWNKLPIKIQNRYPYKPQLSQEEWADFCVNIFEDISLRIIRGVLDNRVLLKQSTAWPIIVEDI